MKYYYHYNPYTGEYTGQIPASGNTGTLPPENTTNDKPDLRLGFLPVRKNNEWTYIEDHRGKIAFAKDGSGALVIDKLGPLPGGFTTEPPLPFKAGYEVKFGKDAWQYIENHIGEVGYVDGERVEIDKLGPLPGGFSTETPPPEPAPPDTRTPEEKRREDYVRLADPIRAQIDGYKAEAEALRIIGDEDGAAAADEKIGPLLLDYLAVKQEIRNKYKDEK